MSCTVGDLLNQLAQLREENRGLKAAADGQANVARIAVERLQRAEKVITAAANHCRFDTETSLDNLERAIETYEESRPS